MLATRTLSRIAGIGVCAALIAGLSGCGTLLPSTPAGSGTAAIGSVLLSVNPEIRIAYVTNPDDLTRSIELLGLGIRAYNSRKQ